MQYLLKAVLTVKDKQGELKKNTYSLSYVVEKLQEVGQNATIYDKELKIYFQNTAALATVFEIEVADVKLALHPLLIKSEDFLKRTLYRFDWIQPRINRQGKLIGIDNPEEIIGQWMQIRTLLLNDYQGDSVKEYIQTIDSQIATQNFSETPLSQYFYYGLVFPIIPPKHCDNWQRNRIVALSDFDTIRLNESITYAGTDGELRKYAITGSPAEKDKSILNKFSGNVFVPINDIHPTEAYVEVEYITKELVIKWNFQLSNY